MGRLTCVLACAAVLAAADARAQGLLQSADLLKLRSVTAVELSPNATRVAYIVENNDGAGRPYGQLWVMTLADGKSVRFGGEKDTSGEPEWSPDGQWIAYRGRVGDKTGLAIARPDGTGARFIAEMTGTNAPLPGSGDTIAWSPDSKRIAFVSSVPGPETADATGVIHCAAQVLAPSEGLDQGECGINGRQKIPTVVKESICADGDPN